MINLIFVLDNNPTDTNISNDTLHSSSNTTKPQLTNNNHNIINELNSSDQEIDFQITNTFDALNLKPILSKKTHQIIQNQPSNWISTFIKEIQFLKANKFVYSIPNEIRFCYKWSIIKILAIYPQETFTFQDVKNKIRRITLKNWIALVTYLNRYECFDALDEQITKKSILTLTTGLSNIANLFWKHNIHLKSYEWSLSDQAIDPILFDTIRRGSKYTGKKRKHSHKNYTIDNNNTNTTQSSHNPPKKKQKRNHSSKEHTL